MCTDTSRLLATTTCTPAGGLLTLTISQEWLTFRKEGNEFDGFAPMSPWVGGRLDHPRPGVPTRGCASAKDRRTATKGCCPGPPRRHVCWRVAGSSLRPQQLLAVGRQRLVCFCQRRHGQQRTLADDPRILLPCPPPDAGAAHPSPQPD